jgi:hypothetical protein
LKTEREFGGAGLGDANVGGQTNLGKQGHSCGTRSKDAR